MSDLFDTFKQIVGDVHGQHVASLLDQHVTRLADRRTPVAVAKLEPSKPVCDTCGSGRLILGERHARCASCGTRLVIL